MSERPVIFDHRLVRMRRQRASSLVAPDFLMRRVADDLADRLASVLRHFPRAADLGTPGEAVLEVLAASGKTDVIVAADAFLSSGGRSRFAESRGPGARRR